MDTKSYTKQIEKFSRDIGFDLFGIASPVPFEKERASLQAWLDRGHAGEMTYLRKNMEKRLDPRKVLPSVKSIICLGVSYSHDNKSESGDDCKSSNLTGIVDVGKIGHIARYARGQDYHKVIKDKLANLKQKILGMAGEATEMREFVDSAPILEKPAAARAGLGFIGRNTVLIHPQHGSFFFLAEILTNLELEPTPPATQNCGSCRACLDACPTQALTESHGLNAARCLAYWIVEARGEIPQEFHAAMGTRIFGCDICQDACPFNQHPLRSRCGEFSPASGAGNALNLDKISQMDETDFNRVYGHTALTRAGYSGIMRNVKIAQKNMRGQ